MPQRRTDGSVGAHVCKSLQHRQGVTNAGEGLVRLAARPALHTNTWFQSCGFCVYIFIAL